jgi:Tfp pilus assembly protein PilP
MVAVSTANPATPAPVGNNTLIGVLELGDRSVAMVEVNGAAQRVGIGQTLDSGWQLMQIADQKAVLQRGGEVRSLSVGQKF